MNLKLLEQEIQGDIPITSGAASLVLPTAATCNVLPRQWPGDGHKDTHPHKSPESWKSAQVPLKCKSVLDADRVLYRATFCAILLFP